MCTNTNADSLTISTHASASTLHVARKKKLKTAALCLDRVFRQQSLRQYYIGSQRAGNKCMIGFQVLGEFTWDLAVSSPTSGES